MARFARTISAQSFRSSLSSSLTFKVLAWSPADLTALFQLGKHCEMEYSEIPASLKNSERVGARPSPLAMALMESKICCLSGIGFYFGVLRLDAASGCARGNWQARKAAPKMKKREKNLPQSKHSFLRELLYTYLYDSSEQNLGRQACGLHFHDAKTKAAALTEKRRQAAALQTSPAVRIRAFDTFSRHR